MDRNVALIGMPRGGTTLACHLLNRCHGVVALSESMDVETLSAEDQTLAISQVESFLREARDELLEHGTALSKHRDGKIPDNTFVGPDGLRRSEQVSRGRIHFQPKPQPGFMLALKHNAAFTALLPALAHRIETVALVRHPLAVLASWNSLDMNAGDGRAPAGERLDPALQARLQQEPVRLERQMILITWFFDRIMGGLPAQRIVRYEDIIATQGQALRCVLAVSEARPGAPLQDMNANPAYAGFDITHLAERLSATHGSWTVLYPPSSIQPLRDRMLAAQNAR